MLRLNKSDLFLVKKYGLALWKLELILVKQNLRKKQGKTIKYLVYW